MIDTVTNPDAPRIVHFGGWEIEMADVNTIEDNALQWSDEVFRIFGYSPGEFDVTIANFLRAVHPDDRGTVRSMYEMAQSGLSTISFDHRIIRADNSIRWVREEATVLKHSLTGTLMRITGTMQDITNLKHVELERAQAVKALAGRNADLERFAFVVSHDLRAPVATILSLAGLLEDGEVDEETRDQCIAGLILSVKKLDETITDLNTIVDLDSSNQERRVIVKFQDVVEDIVLVLGLRPHHIAITTDFSAVDGMTTLKSYIHSIFQNLIANCVKYCQPDIHPVLHIKTILSETTVVVTFHDNCLGIDLLAHANDIFGMRRRFHSHSNGKGMGLYMARKQVEALGGTIQVQSTVNVGSEFILEFAL